MYKFRDTYKHVYVRIRTSLKRISMDIDIYKVNLSRMHKYCSEGSVYAINQKNPGGVIQI